VPAVLQMHGLGFLADDMPSIHEDFRKILVPAAVNVDLDAEEALLFVVETDYGDLPPVRCCLGEINQVVLNLLVNAAHAIGDVVKDTGGLGKLTVRTRCDGNEVEIAIGDTGTGIATLRNQRQGNHVLHPPSDRGARRRCPAAHRKGHSMKMRLSAGLMSPRRA
jgi:hypothetical protein